MTACWGVDIQPHAYLTVSLGEVRQLDQFSGRLQVSR